MFLLLFSFPALAQVTKIRGKVTDAVTGEVIPFANIFIRGTTLGTTSDFDGYYSFEFRVKADSIHISVLGYTEQVKAIKPNVYQEINFVLEPNNILLQEVVVYAGENPADILLRKIIKNKSKNTFFPADYWQFKVYNKTEFDANNFKEDIKNRRIFRDFEFIFDYADTASSSGKTYLPIFISEAISDVYFRKSPAERIEVISAARGSGIENHSLTAFMGNFFEETIIYDNYIHLFGKNIISPIANFAAMYYNYYLVDSAFIENQWCYKLMYKPKRKQELTFSGNFWVHDTTFAIRKVEMILAEDANLNFVTDLSLKQEYELIEGKYWMLKRDYMLADFNLVEKKDTKALGFFGKRTSIYSDFVFDQPQDESFYRSPTKIITLKDNMEHSNDFWKENRPEALTEKEEGIYTMIDSIENVPIFRTYVDIVNMIVRGYIPWGKVEFGTIAKAYSYNEVEGHRFRVGARTSTKFSKKLRFDGHLAYGTKDGRFKYGAGATYVFNNNPFRTIDLHYKYDMEQLGSSFNAFSQDNILNTIFRRNPSSKLNLTSEIDLKYTHEWFSGFASTFSFTHRELIPTGSFTVETYSGNDAQLISHKRLKSSEFGLALRYAVNEKYIIRDFDRINLTSRYPVFNFRYHYAAPNFLNGEYEFHRFQFSVTQWFNLGSIGWSRYNVEAGQLMGTVPYPLLILHPGNETFMFDESAFNLMNYFEFISDRYVSLYYTHHFEGFFLNRIPLMRKLKWREVAFAKGLFGTISNKNLNYNKLPDVTFMLDKPYFEAGVGIENIFKLVRVDGIWRLSHRDNPKASNFAVFVSLRFDF